VAVFVVAGMIRVWSFFAWFTGIAWFTGGIANTLGAGFNGFAGPSSPARGRGQTGGR
jgi:hypothetical protein